MHVELHGAKLLACEYGVNAMEQQTKLLLTYEQQC